MSHNLPTSPLSPPQSMEQKTIFDVIYSPNNPPEFYKDHQLVKAGACPHLVKAKKELKKNPDQENIFENYRSLIQYSMLWHKSRTYKEDSKKRKQKEVKENIHCCSLLISFC